MTNNDLTSKTNKFRPFAVQRAHRPDRDFTQISNTLLRSKIPAQQLKLLCFLLTHEDGFSMSWAHVEKNVLGIARHTRLSALEGLEKLGFVAWAEGGKVLRVADEPMFADVAENPEVVVIDASSAESARVESAPHKNTTTTKNTTNTSEPSSGSTQALNDLKEHSDKSGPRSRADADYARKVERDYEAGKAWIEKQLGGKLDDDEEIQWSIIHDTTSKSYEANWGKRLRVGLNSIKAHRANKPTKLNT